MSTLSFNINLPTEKLKSLDLPIEIRKPNMALVKRTLASQSVGVKPGTYYVTVTLPAGQEISNTVEVGEGAHEVVVLTLDPDDDLSARDDLPKLGKPPNFFLLNNLSFANESEPSDSLHRKSLLLNFEVELSSRPRAVRARRSGWVEKTFVRRGVAARLRRFIGNLLEADGFTTAEDRWERNESESSDVIQFSMKGDDRSQIAQLLQPHRPAVNLTLPAWVEEPCALALTRLPNGGYLMEAHLAHPTANLLMRYLEQGLWEPAADVVESTSLSARELLYQKQRYPIAATVVAYALLRFGDPERLHDWTDSLMDGFAWLPDTVTIRAEHLAMAGQHEEALEVFCELPARGLPCFSDGLSYAVNRLRLYTSLGEKHFKAEKLEVAATLLKRLELFIPFVNFRRPVLTYTGIDPSQPNAVPVENLSEYGGFVLARHRRPKNIVLGIDLGTTKSSVALVEEGEPVIIEIDGSTTMPSVVAVSNEGQLLVGDSARQQGVANPENTIIGVKDFIGWRYEEVAEKAERAAFKVTPDENDAFRIALGGKSWRPELILSKIVRKLARSAESYLGHSVKQVVVSIPSYFDHAQRKAIKDTCRMAGLEVLRMSSEPALAALALKSRTQREGRVAVINLSCSALDIAILQVGPDFIKTLVTASDASLGGDDIDRRIVDWMHTKFTEARAVDLSVDQMALQHLRQVAEKAKIDLSEKDEIEIEMPLLGDDPSLDKRARWKLKRVEFEGLIEGRLIRVIERCVASLREANLEPGDIDEVVLMGGSSRIPKVALMVEEMFGRKPTRVDADELAAVGAAIHGAILSGEMPEVSFIGAMPLSLGLETLGGVFTKLIERNTTIPTRKSAMFTTASDNQTSVEIHVLQGERPMAADNRTLGKFHLVGIPPAPRGMPRFEVTFDIDANGILKVSARDVSTGSEQKIIIAAPSGLSQDEVDRMMRDAESYAADDARKQEETEARNRLDERVYNVEKTFNDNRENVDSLTQLWVEAALADAKKALAEGGIEPLNNAFTELQTASYKLTTALLQQPDVSAPSAASSRAEEASAASGSAEEASAASGSAEAVSTTDYAAEESSEN
jgi:molecular chaperone DnaK